MTIYSKIIEKFTNTTRLLFIDINDQIRMPLVVKLACRNSYRRIFLKTIKVTGFEEPNLAWMAGMDVVADQDYQGALVIVTDTANTARVDDDRYAQGDFLIKIDHHPNEEPYGDLLWVNTEASSCSEMITELAIQSQLELDGDIARLLYAGIVGDTGRFSIQQPARAPLRLLLVSAKKILTLQGCLARWIPLISRLPS